MVTVQKHLQGDEPFDANKVGDSVWEACRTAGWSQEDCNEIADTVQNEVAEWVADQDTVMSEEIREKVEQILERVAAEVAYVYKQHRKSNLL